MNSCAFSETKSGTHFSFVNFHPDMLVADDIMQGLSHICRYMGQGGFFTVAEHSILVASVIWPSLRFAALLHDGAEGYVSDLNPALKERLPDYHYIEHKIQSAIYVKFRGRNLTPDEYKLIKYADRGVLKAEAAVLFDSQGRDWGITEPAAFVEIHRWCPEEALSNIRKQWKLLEGKL